ncbi:unnamed protein product [Spirodela intermedia]|uniref:Receptor-like serine/threonine-protein kinase n=1 Tax=Spirodela intermedia TaxID=51605 RepID=A0A7I8IBB6_SPIIN|nr:unnamed protein product [Spirodela intermedia]CAA6655046.1 unnamed protein product [Spirodela intermedia]
MGRRNSRVIPLAWLLVVLVAPPAFCRAQSSLSRGSSLSVERASDTLVSPGRTFSCGFLNVGINAFILGIWFTADPNKTEVWSANRERPVNGRGSRLSLRSDGVLELTDAGKEVVWQAGATAADGKRVELLEEGNLVVRAGSGSVLWQSFDFPTHTLLPRQALTKTTKLVASLSGGSPNPGYYFFFDNDNVLKLMYDGSEVSSIYWPSPDRSVFENGRTPYNSSRRAVLDETGRFTSSDLYSFNASDAGGRRSRRLTLGHDGNLRLYSLSEAGGWWQVTWEAMPQLCNVHGQCGRNGICVNTPEARCFCPPGHEMKLPGDWKKGCRRTVEVPCGKPGGVKFVEIPNTDFYGFDLSGFANKVSFETCKKRCEEDCNCNGFGYRLTGEGRCYPKGILFNGYTSPNFPGSIFLKLPLGLDVAQTLVSDEAGTACNSTRDDARAPLPPVDLYARKGGLRWAYVYAFVAALGLIELLFMATGWWFVFGHQASRRSTEEGYRLMTSQFRKFTYRELKKATDNFKHELGRGGAGAVYRGVLDDKRVAAVKKLDNVTQGAEDSHRLLVSELQERGSLDQVLFPRKGGASAAAVAAAPLEWEKRFKIALGTARGLAYLHHECLEWIVHCDVKPENILLDEDFGPKIADFGLAKLLQRGTSDGHITRIRGTKVDVYSYGVVLLEIVMGRRVSDVPAGEEEDVTGVSRLLGGIKRAMDGGGDGQWVDDYVDPRLGGNYNRKQAAVMLEIAASSMEADRTKRPSMDSVAETLLSCDNNKTGNRHERQQHE